MAQSKYAKPADESPEAKRPLPKKKVMTVVTDDGSVLQANIGRPGLRRAYIAAHGGQEPADEWAAYWMLWHALGRPQNTGDDEADLAAFIDSIQAEDIEEQEVDLTSTPTSQG